MTNDVGLRVGGMALRIKGGKTAASVFDIGGMAVFRNSPSVADYEVITDSQLTLPSPEWSYSCEGEAVAFRFGHCEPFVIENLLQPVGNEPFVCMQFVSGASLLFNPAQPRRVLLSSVPDLSELRFALWMAFALLGQRNNAVPVHSSVVVKEGRAVLFLGESGTGKSTHTRLWLNHIEGSKLLNDDSPVVVIHEGRVWACGSPWSGKTPCYHQHAFPVAAIVRLEQQPYNQIARCSTIQAFSALQPSCPPAFVHVDSCRELLLQFVASVVDRVPVYRLGCLPDKAAAELSYHTVFQS